MPSPFTREHFQQLGRVVTLENEDGRTWKVSFGMPKRNPQWLQGWDRVATDNNFKPGDVVVFVLIANSRFRFTLFDEDGNIIKSISSISNYAAPKKETRCSSQESYEAPSASNLDEHLKPKKRALVLDNIQSTPEAKSGEPGEFPVPQMQTTTHEQIAEPPCKRKLRIEDTKPNPSETPSSDPRPNSTAIQEQKCGAPDNGNPQRKLQEIPPLDPFAFTFKSKRRPTTRGEKQSAMDTAMAHAGALTKHHFVTVMSETQVYSDFYLVSSLSTQMLQDFDLIVALERIHDVLNTVQVLPESFVTKSCFPTSATKLTIMDCDGKPWEMISNRNKSNKVVLHRRYWALFALHHLLEEGDVCVFHLRKNDQSPTIVLQVHIFRVLPLSIDCAGRPISVHDHFETRMIENLF